MWDRRSDCVYLAGMGARTPVGLHVAATAAAVRAGIAGMTEHPYMIDKAGEPMVVCADAVLPPVMRGVDRLLELALPPAREALEPAVRRRTKPAVSIFLGLPENRPGRPHDLESTFSARMASALSEVIRVDEINCYGLGNAAGLFAVEKAMDTIVSGRSEFCLVGGVDSYLDPDTLEWLDSDDHLHSDATVWGLCPSEASGFCLLASGTVAHSLGFPTAPQMVAAGSATEPNRINTETVCIGEGLSAAFQRTLAGLPEGRRVNHTICDMNGEPYRGNEYGFAMLRSNRWFDEDADFSTPADCWGDIGAASGPLFAILAACAIKKAYSPGPVTFLWASSDSGLRAAALMEAPVGQG